jgi:hypothetical protein
MVATIYPSLTKDQRPYDVVNSFREADESIVGYIFAHARLPCPANDSSGIENCTLSQGIFPYRTLGMAQMPANAAGLDMHYSVFRRPNNDLRLDADLAVTADRYHPFWAQDLPPIAQPRALGQRNALDFCQGLSVGGGSTFNTNFLHVGADTSAEHVAYLLLDAGLKDASGDGDPLDGVNVTGNLHFERPEVQADRNNDDRVYVRYFAELQAELGCSNVLLPTGLAAL